MRGLVCTGVVLASAIVACRFSPSFDGDGDAGVVPDAGPCQDLSSQCADESTLRSCTAIGQMPVDTSCAWGCIAGGDAHCGVLVPTGSGATSDDLKPDPALADVSLFEAIDTNTGQIGGSRDAGAGIKAGIDWEIRGGYSIFRAKSWHVTADVIVRGKLPLVLVATGDVTIDHTLDLRGDCMPGTVTAGPGGFDGGSGNGSGQGDTGGAGGTGSAGGGGGGHGGLGGPGGNASIGGAAGGDPLLATLTGGGGGGAGGNTAAGGGGGGAIQIVANGTIKLGPRVAMPPPGYVGAINASGCGGTKGDTANNGGGGGAGGAVLLEAHDLVIQGFVAANGGGGGAGGTGDGPPPSQGRSGEKGQASRQRADGGKADMMGPTDGSGGDGAAGSDVNGFAGGAAPHSGGGGGGIGILRFHSASGSAAVGANNLSPDFDDPGGHATQGSAHVQ